MKRFLVALLVLLLIVPNMVIAEADVFNHKQLANLDGYSYDKFDKTWSYYGAYLKEYADATVVVGIKAFGDATSVKQVILYAWLRDEYNREVYSPVSEVQILADETLITCKVMQSDTSSITFFTDSSNEALRIIGNANEIQIKVTFAIGSITLTPSKSDIAEFAQAARNIYKYKMVSYVKDTSAWNTVKLLFPITIE